jgi:hypothetical protein
MTLFHWLRIRPVYTTVLAYLHRLEHCLGQDSACLSSPPRSCSTILLSFTLSDSHCSSHGLTTSHIPSSSTSQETFVGVSSHVTRWRDQDYCFLSVCSSLHQRSIGFLTSWRLEGVETCPCLTRLPTWSSHSHIFHPWTSTDHSQISHPYHPR